MLEFWSYDFWLQQSDSAHWYIFGLFLLSGLCIPISEDFLVLFAAVLSSTAAPDQTIRLFAACYAGAYFSDLLCYSLGRLLGFRILDTPPLNKLISKRRLTEMLGFYEKKGHQVLLVGRFIPFGFRNAMYLGAGISKMPFAQFALFDFLACTATTSTLFFLGRILVDKVIID